MWPDGRRESAESRHTWIGSSCRPLHCSEHALDASRCRVARVFACLSRFMRLDSAPPGEWRDALGEWEALTWLHVFFDDAEQPDMLRTALPDLQWVQVGGAWGMSIDASLALWGPSMLVPRPGERDASWPADGFSWCQGEVCPAAAFTRIWQILLRIMTLDDRVICHADDFATRLRMMAPCTSCAESRTAWQRP